MSTNCSFPEDCTLTTPSGQVIVQNCYRSALGSNRIYFCGCSDTFGWVGEFCEEASLQSWFLRISASFSLISCFYLLVIVLKFSREFLKLNLKTDGLVRIEQLIQKKKARRRVFLILLLLWLALVCAASFGVLTLVSVVDSSNFELYTYKYVLNPDVRVVNLRGGIFLDIALVGLGTFTLSASLQISLSWVEILEKFEAIFDETQTRRLRRYKISVKYVITFLISLNVLFMVTSYLIPAMILAVVCSLSLLVVFVKGRRAVLTKNRQIGLSNQPCMVLIEKSTFGHCICLSLISLLSVSSGVVDAFQVYPGMIKPLSITTNGVVASCLLLIYYNLWYIGSIINNLGVKAVDMKAKNLNV